MWKSEAQGPVGTSTACQGGHRRLVLGRNAIRRAEGAAVSQVGTILLVAMAVAMMTVVGVYVMGLVNFDEPVPTMEVVTSSQTDRMHAHIKHVSEARPISEFRLVAHDEEGNLVIYDSDGDAVGDAVISTDLDLLTVDSAIGPLRHPLVYVDADTDDRVSSGDFITYRHPFFPPTSPFIDTTHGYKVVEQAPNGIHRDSTMLIVASPDTLVGSDLMTGDTVRVTIGKGGVTFAEVEGTAGLGGIWTATIDIPIDWTPATYGETVITVRSGEPDVWTLSYPFKVLPENPVSKAEQAYYDRLNNPLTEGSWISLVHVPSNTIVAEFLS